MAEEVAIGAKLAQIKNANDEMTMLGREALRMRDGASDGLHPDFDIDRWANLRSRRNAIELELLDLLGS